MPVYSTSSYSGPYSCNGVQKIFPFTFPIFDPGDVRVVLRDQDGNETVLVYSTHYAMSKSGPSWENGGNVTTVQAYSTGYTILIERVLPIDQKTDYLEHDTFPAEIHENDHDKITMIAQQLDTESGRALKFPISDPESSRGELPPTEQRKNKYLAFDGNGKPVGLTNVVPGTVTITDFAGTLLDDTDADTARATLDAARADRIRDDDGDTKVETEASLDEDIIRLTAGGNLALTVAGSAITLKKNISCDSGIGLSLGSDLQVSGGLIVGNGAILNSVVVITSGSTYSPTSGTKKIFVIAVGAGGGAGGCGAMSGGNFGGGGGGGAGAVAMKLITDPASSYSISIGSGGTGGSGANGGSSGGNTTFGTGITAGGGGGGSYGVANGIYVLGGAGGTASGGDINIPGAPGMPATGGYSFAGGGVGGSGMYGSGGRGGGVSAGGGTSAGSNASGYGAGGGGAGGYSSGSAQNGGSGTNGVIIVYEYI